MPDFDFQPAPAEVLNEVGSKSLYTVDGLWFLAVEEEFGFETAFKLNQQVWKKASLLNPVQGLRRTD
ncbi:MAG: DUF6125 family protein [Dehalococcoidales bacterium]|nr:DUF6125 family protein [Dehalococcoidales bacterium]